VLILLYFYPNSKTDNMYPNQRNEVLRLWKSCPVPAKFTQNGWNWSLMAKLGGTGYNPY